MVSREGLIVLALALLLEREKEDRVVVVIDSLFDAADFMEQR